MEHNDLQWLCERIWGRMPTEEEQAALGDAWQRVAFEAGDCLIEQGEPGKALWLVREGAAEIVLQRGVRKLRIANARAGALLGEMSFLTGAPASASVVASEAGVAYRLSRDKALSLMRAHPELMLGLFAYMLAHHAETVRRMNEEFFQLYDYMVGAHK